MKSSSFVLKIVIIFYMAFLPGCSTVSHYSKTSAHAKDSIQKGGITILPTLSSAVAKNYNISNRDEIIAAVQDRIEKIIKKKYPNSKVVSSSELFAKTGELNYLDIYENECNGSEECFIDFLEGIVETRTLLFADKIEFNRTPFKCEFFFCIFGAEYSAIFKGVIYDRLSKEKVAELRGSAFGFSGIGAYFLPPLVWPMVSPSPKSLILKACESSFQQPE